MVPVLAVIVQAGAVVAAISAIVGAVAAAVRWAVLRPLRRSFEDRLDTLQDSFDERLRPIEYQLNPNGGGSMRDAVRRIEHKVEDVQHALAAYEAKTSTFIRAQATALQREGVSTPRPEDFGIQ